MQSISPQNWKSCITNNQINDTASLYIVATPIGNLLDISLRALMILDQVDMIFCEDTRKSGILLAHYGIVAPKKSYRIHQAKEDTKLAIQKLQEGQRVAFISDAGTPGISDPCSLLVRSVRNECPEVDIIPIPGASAMAAALSISGWQTNPTQFLGFLPIKKGKRQAIIDSVEQYTGTVVVYESVHRIEKLLLSLQSLNKEREIIVLRELTKVYEETIFFPVDSDETFWHQRLTHLRKKGEFTVMIGPKK